MNPEELRADIPAAQTVAYFNTGASGPSPRRVVDAVSDCQAYHSFESPTAEGMYPAAFEILDDVRETVADFVGATPGEIALTQSTTDGINLVADAIDWEPGDVVVRTDVEHPAGILPWKRRRDTDGIVVRTVESEDGRLSAADFEDAVSDARLVCLSSIAWNYGTRLPVREIADLAHDAGALVLCDAVQSPGQVPVDVAEWGVDFLAGAGHKWLLGPWGAGFLYVDEAVGDRLEPRRIGSGSVVDSAAERYEYKPTAAKLEVSTMPVAPYRGLATAMETIEAVGLGTIQDRIETLTDRLKEGLGEDRLHSPTGYESGLVSFRVDDPEAAVERLADEGVVIRDIPYPECVRASVHAFNTEGDVDALLSALP